MKKINLLLFIFSVFFSCTAEKRQDFLDEMYCKKASRTVDKMFSDTGPKLAKKYKLSYVGNGAAMFGGPIRTLCLDFEVRHKLNKNEARRLLLNIGIDFLSIINNDHKIYPYLANKPFKLENIEICIFLFDGSRNEFYDPDFAVVELNKGIFIYRTLDSSPPHAYLNRYKESLEEPEAILDKEDSDNLQPRE